MRRADTTWKVLPCWITLPVARSSISLTPAGTSTNSRPRPPRGGRKSHLNWLAERLTERDASDTPALLATGRDLSRCDAALL